MRLHKFFNAIILGRLSTWCTQAAEKLVISRPRLSDTINGTAGISPVMALKLSKAFNNTPYLWMNMKNSYDLWHATKASKDVNKGKAPSSL
jgi:addiction module HigA family antidote